MKQILFICLLALTLISCKNTNPKIELANRAKETNEQLIIDACNDLTLYKIVVKDNILYAISDEDDLVSYKITNELTPILFFMITLIGALITMLIISILVLIKGSVLFYK
mgnify:CR=1 FL=1